MNINATTPVNGSDRSVDQAMPAPAIAKDQRAGNTRQVQPTEQDAPLAEKEAKDLVEGLNEMMDGLQTSIGFSIHEGDSTDQVVVQIKDRNTDELIKQIPSEELLVIKEKMEEFTGLLLDHQI